MTAYSWVLRIFLGIYALLLLQHIGGELQELTAISAILFASGAAIALYAHSRSGALLYALLCVHMAIEWIGYGMQGWTFSGSSGKTFDLIHLCFDVGFLFLIAHWTWPKHQSKILVCTLSALTALSGTAWLILRHAAGLMHEYPLHAVEFLILGGIFGCTGFHIIWPLKIRT